MHTVQWLVQSTADYPELAAGTPPAELLQAGELARLASLATPKRRHDWLLGRWTAKHLLQAFLRGAMGRAPALKDIVICNNADGVPLVGLSDGADEPLRPLRVALSISHCEAYALAAVHPAPMRPEALLGDSWEEATRLAVLGADIERVRSRTDGFVADYFTAGEQTRTAAAPAAQRDELVTVIWSAKEAALKAVQLGLSVDTRRVDCVIDPLKLAGDEWQSFHVLFQPEGGGTQRLDGWWRRMGDYVLTLASRAAG